MKVLSKRKNKNKIRKQNKQPNVTHSNARHTQQIQSYEMFTHHFAYVCFVFPFSFFIDKYCSAIIVGRKSGIRLLSSVFGIQLLLSFRYVTSRFFFSIDISIYFYKKIVFFSKYVANKHRLHIEICGTSSFPWCARYTAATLSAFFLRNVIFIRPNNSLLYQLNDSYRF